MAALLDAIHPQPRRDAHPTAAEFAGQPRPSADAGIDLSQTISSRRVGGRRSPNNPFPAGATPTVPELGRPALGKQDPDHRPGRTDPMLPPSGTPAMAVRAIRLR